MNTVNDLVTVREAAGRVHPDLFTAEEAAGYLHLDSIRGLETCRTKFGLNGYDSVNKAMIYHREDLDRCALRMVGKDPVINAVEHGRLRIAGARAR